MSKIKLNGAMLFPLVSKLGNYLKAGLDNYVMLRAAGMEPDAEMIAVYIEGELSSWHPEFKGTDLLDPETKQACARFLGGVASNIAKGVTGD